MVVTLLLHPTTLPLLSSRCQQFNAHNNLTIIPTEIGLMVVAIMPCDLAFVSQQLRARDSGADN